MSARSGDRRSILAAAGACIAGVSLAPILIRQAALPALGVAFWRNAIAAMLFLPWMVGRRALRGRDRLGAIAAGVFLGIHFAAWTASLDHTTVANSTAILAIQPAVVLVLGLLVGDRLSNRAWTAVVLAGAGGAIVGGADLSGASGRLYGNALSALGALAGGVYFTIGRRVRASAPLFAYSATLFASAALVDGVLAFATGTPLAYDVSGFGWIVLMVVTGQLLGHTIFNLLLSHLPGWAVAVTSVGEAVGAAALAWILLDEAPTLGFWLGGPVVAVGVLVAVRGSAGPTSRRRGPWPPDDGHRDSGAHLSSRRRSCQPPRRRRRSRGPGES